MRCVRGGELGVQDSRERGQSRGGRTARAMSFIPLRARLLRIRILIHVQHALRRPAFHINPGGRGIACGPRRRPCGRRVRP